MTSFAAIAENIGTGVPRSVELRLALDSLFAEARALVARSRALCLAYRRIGGGSDAGSPVEEVVTATAKRAATTRNEALWQFLESHRGSMYCTQCIASALRATKRIDRAVIGAEGRGARRRYGACVSCGKERLLCGLAS